MGATIIVNARTVVHKDSGGKAPSVPDFCKTPTPPGAPVPIPYVNIAQSSDTADGSKKVKMDGNPIMLKTSKFSTSKGDEAGTAKGVASSTTSGIAKFVNYSFDVKVEGKNVPRLGDPMTNNGNGPNALTPKEVQDLVQEWGISEDEMRALCEAFCDAQEAYERGDIKGSNCMSKEFKKNIRKMKKSGRLSNDWHPEQTFYFPPIGDPEYLTPGLFRKFAANVAGTPLHNLVKGIAGKVRRVGMTVKESAGIRMSRVFSIFNKTSGGIYAGHCRRPDLIRCGPEGKKVFDAKFESRDHKRPGKWRKDEFRDDQGPDHQKLDHKGKLREIDGERCGCSMPSPSK